MGLLLKETDPVIAKKACSNLQNHSFRLRRRWYKPQFWCACGLKPMQGLFKAAQRSVAVSQTNCIRVGVRHTSHLTLEIPICQESNGARPALLKAGTNCRGPKKHRISLQQRNGPVSQTQHISKWPAAGTRDVSSYTWIRIVKFCPATHFPGGGSAQVMQWGCTTVGQLAAGGNRLLSFSKRPDRRLYPRYILCNGYRDLFPGGKEVGAWSWELTCTQCRREGRIVIPPRPLHAFMARTRNTPDAFLQQKVALCVLVTLHYTCQVRCSKQTCQIHNQVFCMTTALRVNDHGTWRQRENSRLQLRNVSHVEEWQLQTARFKKCTAVPAQAMKAWGEQRHSSTHS